MITIQGEVTRLPRVEFVLHQIRILFESQLYGTIESDKRNHSTDHEWLQNEQQIREYEH